MGDSQSDRDVLGSAAAVEGPINSATCTLWTSAALNGAAPGDV